MVALLSPVVVLVIVLVLVVWLFLARTISSRKEDARLQFRVRVKEALPISTSRPGSVVSQPAANLPERTAKPVLHPAAQEAVSRGERCEARPVWEELPLLLAAALRGRAT